MGVDATHGWNFNDCSEFFLVIYYYIGRSLREFLFKRRGGYSEIFSELGSQLKGYNVRGGGINTFRTRVWLLYLL